VGDLARLGRSGLMHPNARLTPAVGGAGLESGPVLVEGVVGMIGGNMRPRDIYLCRVSLPGLKPRITLRAAIFHPVERKSVCRSGSGRPDAQDLQLVPLQSSLGDDIAAIAAQPG
jgi:hypothetical protein